jgi:hypothetical protein
METNLSRSFITCLEWMRICVGFLLIAWSGNEYLHDLHCLIWVETNLCMIFIACLECKWICAGYLLLVYVCIGVGDSVILLNPCILCTCHKLRPGFSTSHVVVVYDLIWSERLLFLLLIFVVLLTITLYNYFSKLSGRNIV